MTIRGATRADIRAIGEICAAAFRDEELFGELMHPNRREYPDDFAKYWERKIWNHWFDYQRTILVSIDEPSCKVVGIADWQRQGKGGEKRELAKLDPRNLVKHVVSYSSRLSAWMWPNRAADASKATVLEDSFPLVEHYWLGPRKENWALDLLAVHPDFEGKGHGKRLVQWGINEANKEGICTSVISAHQKERFYETFGFAKVGMANVGHLAENGIKGGTIMFIDI